MFKFSLSVRAYYNGVRYGLPDFEDWADLSAEELQEACAYSGTTVLRYNRGLRTGVELLRASGLGVYDIHKWTKLYGYGHTVEEIRSLCDRFDNSLHGVF